MGYLAPAELEMPPLFNEQVLKSFSLLELAKFYTDELKEEGIPLKIREMIPTGPS